MQYVETRKTENDVEEEYFDFVSIVLNIPDSATADQLTPEQTRAVRMVLEGEGEGSWQKKSFGRAKLELRTKIIIWTLASYVPVMMALIGTQFLIGITGPKP